MNFINSLWFFVPSNLSSPRKKKLLAFVSLIVQKKLSMFSRSYIRFATAWTSTKTKTTKFTHYLPHKIYTGNLVKFKYIKASTEMFHELISEMRYTLKKYIKSDWVCMKIYYLWKKAVNIRRLFDWNDLLEEIKSPHPSCWLASI